MSHSDVLKNMVDQAALESVRAHCIPLDQEGKAWGLADNVFSEVRHLNDADPGVRKAYAWLSRRRLCRLAHDKVGEFIVLTSVSHAKRSAGGVS